MNKPPQTRTSAQRYNNRLDKIFDNAKILGQQRYKEDAERIRLLTEEINKKAHTYTIQPAYHLDDLLYVIGQLENINDFLKPNQP